MFVSTARYEYVTAQVQVPILKPTFKNSLKGIVYNTVRLAKYLATCSIMAKYLCEIQESS